MPSFWTHASFAEECKEQLSDLFSIGAPMGYLSDAILAHPHAFFTGMQGPDLFLFYLPAALRKERLSTLLHTKHSAKLLCCLFARAHTYRGEDRRRALAYVCGFLGHYLLDSHTHAFVYARAGVGYSLNSFCTHNALESDLNRLTVESSLGIPLRTLPRPRSYALTPAERRILSSLLCSALRDVYGIDTSPAMVARAFSAVHLFTGILYDSTGRKAKLAKIAEAPIGKPLLSPLFLGESHYFADPANQSHRSWTDPYTGKRSQDSFFDLYDRALARFLPILRRLESEEGRTPRARRILFEKLCRRDFHGEPITP